MDTKHTPPTEAALRAADRITDAMDIDEAHNRQVAEIIDAETGHRELLQTLANYAKSHRELLGGRPCICVCCEDTEAALSRAGGGA